MKLAISVHRDDVIVDQAPNSALLLRAIVVTTFLSPGRVPTLAPIADLPVVPGNVYRAYTGISIPGLVVAHQVRVRAAAKAWRSGLDVVRVDVDPELVVYFTVRERMTHDRLEPMFELFFPNLRPGTVFDLTLVTAVSIPTPGLNLALEPKGKHVREVAKPVAAAAVTPDAEKAVRAWLDAPDERGRVVGGGGTIPRPMPDKGSVTLVVGAVDPQPNTGVFAPLTDVTQL